MHFVYNNFCSVCVFFDYSKLTYSHRQAPNVDKLQRIINLQERGLYEKMRGDLVHVFRTHEES